MPNKTVGRYAVEVVADRSGKYCGNALRFDSVADAEAYARDLWSRWTLVSKARVVDATSIPPMTVLEVNL